MPDSNVLNDKHRDELHASGLTDETIAAAGFYSADSAEIKKILGWFFRFGFRRTTEDTVALNRTTRVFATANLSSMNLPATPRIVSTFLRGFWPLSSHRPRS